MGALQELTPDMLKRTTQIDYDREMAMVAVIQHELQDSIIGISRYVTNPDFQSSEFALVVADQWQNKGIGRQLMTCLIQAAITKQLKIMTGEIMSNNVSMLSLVKHLGFSVKPSDKDISLQIATKLLF